MPTVYFAKTNSEGRIPSKRHEDSAYDIYAAFPGDLFEIRPHRTELVPTGIASALEPGWGFQIEERGSTGSIGMKKSAGVIDAGYRGEWFIAITNTNDKSIIISKHINEIKETDITIAYPYSKAICQAKLEKIYEAEIIEIPYEELKLISSERGMGKLGNSGK